MAERYDPKNRKLKTGETYNRKSGRYRYTYVDANGKRRSVYSYTLTPKDPIPAGVKQKPGESLREREKKIDNQVYNEQMGLVGVTHRESMMTVYDLMKRRVDRQFKDVRESTRNGYRTQLRFMSTNPFGKKKICEVTEDEAQHWFDELHEKCNKNYSSLHTLRGILRPAFEDAKGQGWVQTNPFDFSMLKKRYGGTKTRDAVTKEQMRRFLDFVRTSRSYKKYFDGMYILFNTGLRISEFCGLTENDIDFDNHVIYVRRQLLRLHDGNKTLFYLEDPKTDNGKRIVPMLKDVEECFREVIANRPHVKREVSASYQDGHETVSGFLFLDKNGNPEVAQHWENHFRWAVNRYNQLFKEELPSITPHVCRHTFCSNCASVGMAPKTLQMIMGHSSIQFTLDVYTHVEAGDIKKEFFGALNDRYDFYPLDRKPEYVDIRPDEDLEEPEPDLDEIVDEDD